MSYRTDSNSKVYDDTAPLEFVYKNGYYIVNNKNFNYKINALEEATKSKQPVQWVFNDKEFKALNWRTSSHVPLTDLYKSRAQQLRNKYDYLVLLFSGGSDSTTILKSFIDNNIKLDEIICDWPLKHTSGFRLDASLQAENMPSEWQLSIKPCLEKVRLSNPKIKITILDSAQDMSIEDQEDTCTITLRHSYISIKRYRAISDYLKSVNNQHRNVAAILGTEKPSVLVTEKNVFCAQFWDDSCWYKSSYVDYPRNIEYFYWTADMPEITRDQSHVIYRYLKSHPHLIELFKPPEDLTKWEKNQRFEFCSELIKMLIYPNWDRMTFQVKKPISAIYNNQYAWASDPSSLAMQSWESSLRSRYSLIDRQYLMFFENSNQLYSYKDFYSRLYPIGMLP